MKLAYIEMSGFRAFRDLTRIDLPHGFVVVTGRNGAGKSTICDAIEFALTGRIRGTSTHKEKGETIADYLWWRGSDPPKDQHVELGLESTQGKPVTIRRDRDGTVTGGLEDAHALLVDQEAMLDDPLAQLCRTAILRDEEITRLSVDLAETERFDFVRAALGTADFSVASEKAKRVADILKRQMELAQNQYRLNRERVADVTARLSQARAEASKTALLSEAEASLKLLLPDVPSDAAARLMYVERAVATERTRLDNLTRLLGRLRSISERRKEVLTASFQARLAAAEEAVINADAALRNAERNADALAGALRIAQQETPRVSSLAQLHEHGARLGLQNSKCPLCGTERTEAEFHAHLEQLRIEMESTSIKAEQLARAAADASTTVEQHRARLNQLRRQLEEARRAGAELTSEFERLRHEMSALGFIPTSGSETVLSELSEHIDSARTKMARLESANAVLRSSQRAAKLVEFEREVASAQEQVTAAEKAVSKVAIAQDRAKEALQTIKRVQGEIVDEQLAELSPLLEELYSRLRPHIDWRTVRYTLRGDVRRMLSVVVGTGLNPSFVFSSGQRRAAGLAFLLAIHLSRAWCKLETLLLDDPVQHVDDYRALHLTEVLAAIRRTGRQVLCTVEDRALAELLARRLRSDVGSEGTLLELVHRPGAGAEIADQRTIRPFAHQVLVSGVAV